MKLKEMLEKQKDGAELQGQIDSLKKENMKIGMELDQVRRKKAFK
jgi:hypothetical protein